MKERVVCKIEKIMPAPIEQVFVYLTDDEKIKEWNALFVENIYFSEEDKNACVPGTKYISVSVIEKKEYRYEAELVSYDFPYCTSVKGTTKEGTSLSSYTLAETAEGTLVTVEVTLAPKNLYYQLTSKMFGWVTKLLLDEQLDQLVSLLKEMMTLEELAACKPTKDWKQRMHEGDELFTSENIHAVEAVLDVYINQLTKLGDQAEEKTILECVKQVVRALNEINESHDYFIDTLEREELAEFIEKGAHIAGLKAEEDITEEWREW